MVRLGTEAEVLSLSGRAASLRARYGGPCARVAFPPFHPTMRSLLLFGLVSLLAFPGVQAQNVKRTVHISGAVKVIASSSGVVCLEASTRYDWVQVCADEPMLTSWAARIDSLTSRPFTLERGEEVELREELYPGTGSDAIVVREISGASSTYFIVLHDRYVIDYVRTRRTRAQIRTFAAKLREAIEEAAEMRERYGN